MTPHPRSTAAAALCGVVFLALAWPGAGSRGVIAEEVQPSLPRHPHVLTDSEQGIGLMPPWEADAPARPRWVATPQWPVLSWDGETRQWPVFIRGHQSALGTWVALGLGAALGGGVAGLQHANVVLSLSLVLLAWVLARRVWTAGRDLSLLAPALVALSFGTLFFARTGYSFELVSRVAMTCALVVASPLRPLSPARALGIGLWAGLAILSRATIVVTLAPALLILLSHPARAVRPSRLLLLGAVAAGLPLLSLGAVVALAPFAAGTAPLEGFPWHQLGERVLSAPGHLLVQLAWLGDANTILGPLRDGVSSSSGVLLRGAAVSAVPVGAALVRWWRGTAGDGERMLVAGVMGNVVVGALLYRSPAQFQLAMALEVLLAVALAEQLAALAAFAGSRWLLAALLAFGLRGAGLVVGLVQDRHVSNPMFSARTQLELVAQLQRLGVRGPELLTTAYDHAGVVEAWTQGALTPLHGWWVLRVSRPEDGASLPGKLERVLRTVQPRYVLLSVGSNPMASGFTDDAALARALRTAAERLGGTLGRTWDFPTETGAPGWQLVELNAPTAP